MIGFNKEELALVVLCTLPSFSMYLYTGSSLFAVMGLVASCSFIVYYAIRCDTLNLLLHITQIFVLSIVLYECRANTLVFALMSATVCACYIGFSGGSKGLRVYGTFIIVPSLYIANELYRIEASGLEYGLESYIKWFPFLAMPAVIFATALNYLDRRPLWRFDKFWQHGASREQVAEAWVTGMAAFFAVGLTIVIAKYSGIEHYEWIIWSAVSVCTGELISMKKKVQHRVLGSVLAVVIAGLLAHYGVQYDVIAILAVLLIPATITLNHYFFAFTLRSFLTVFAASSIDFSVEKLTAVIVGCFIGFVLAFLMMRIHQYFKGIPSGHNR